MEKIIHNKEEQKFYLNIENKKAFVKYKITNNFLDIIATYVPKALEGKGIASVLVNQAYNYASSLKLKPIGSCSYAAAWLKRNRRV